MKELPLVSVCVITYNSSLFVLETLESIKEQTYQNIELIISDDCSIDSTVDVCRGWLKENENRFVNTEIVVTDKNTGVSANCNRVVNSAKGEWIKLIAGDDCLLPDCISANIEFIDNNPDASIVHSKIAAYRNTFDKENFLHTNNMLPKSLISLSASPREQFNSLALGCHVAAPTSFIKKELIIRVGGFDESIPSAEDWPMWLLITLNNEKFFFLNSITVKYRVHQQSVYGSVSIGLLFGTFFDVNRLVYKRIVKKNAPVVVRMAFQYDYIMKKTLSTLGLNKPTKLCSIIYRVLLKPSAIVFCKYVNPVDVEKQLISK